MNMPRGPDILWLTDMGGALVFGYNLLKFPVLSVVLLALQCHRGFLTGQINIPEG